MSFKPSTNLFYLVLVAFLAENTAIYALDAIEATYKKPASHITIVHPHPATPVHLAPKHDSKEIVKTSNT